MKRRPRVLVVGPAVDGVHEVGGARRAFHGGQVYRELAESRRTEGSSISSGYRGRR